MIRENIWIMNYFPGPTEVEEFCGWLDKFGKDFNSKGIRNLLPKALIRKHTFLNGKECTLK